MSYIGYVTGSREGFLLGGVKHHKSSRFRTREAAEQWVWAILKGNCEAHRAVTAWGWKQSNLSPEIDQ